MPEQRKVARVLFDENAGGDAPAQDDALTALPSLGQIHLCRDLLMYARQ